jgi:hypothetical protein
VINNSHTDSLNSYTPEEIRLHLLVTSIILSSYEIIKSMVIKRTKFSFLTGFGYGGDKYSDEYNTDVLARDKSPLIASAKYLADHYEAISSDDVDQIVALRDLRNDIAHDLPTVLVKRNYEDLSEYIKRARDLVFKLDNFWVYIETGHDPEHSGTNWDTAYSNSTMFVDHLIELIDGYKRNNG